MGLIVLPLLLIVVVAPTDAPAAKLADFTRFSRAINAEIALVDREGAVREGVLASAAADQLTMQFGGGQKTFARSEVVSAERLRDGRRDGVIKGAIFGAIVGVFAMQGFDSVEEGLAGWAGSVAIYTGIGWALDASQTHRQPVYHAAPAAAAPPVKVSLRF